jgi:hypothetical protein
VFYLLHELSSIPEDDTRPEIIAIMLMAGLTYIEIMCILFCLEPLTHVRTYTPGLSLIQGMLIAAILAIPHYLVIIRGRRYQSIIARIKQRTRAQRARQTVITLLLLAAPPTVFGIFMWKGILH